MSADARRTVRVGLIGLGAIGGEVLEARDRGALPGIEIAAVLVRRAREERRGGTLVTADPARFAAERPEAVFECAGHQAMRDHGERVLAGGADLYVTSVGAFADDALLARLLEAARRAGRRIVLPAAGIGALDIVAAGAAGGLDAVEITVRKDIASWRGTVAETTHDLRRATAPIVLFDGPVREGARAYPQNVNIAAAVALAGIGLDRKRLRIVADPAISAHVVEVRAHGAFGRFEFREEVIPSGENPKTGRLVGMAIVKTIRQLASPLVVGG